MKYDTGVLVGIQFCIEFVGLRPSDNYIKSLSYPVIYCAKYAWGNKFVSMHEVCL